MAAKNNKVSPGKNQNPPRFSLKKIGIIAGLILTVVTIVTLIKTNFFDSKEKPISQNNLATDKAIITEGNGNTVAKDGGINVQGNGNTVYVNSKDGNNNRNDKSSNNSTEKHNAFNGNENIDTSKAIRIAILPFDHLSNQKDYDFLEQAIAESLLNSFSANEKYNVVETLQRDKILKEIDLQQGKYFDEKSVAKIGKQLGAKQVIVGSYQINNENIQITSRIVNVESGKIEKKSIIEHEGLLSNISQVEKELALKLMSCLNKI